MDRLTPLPRDDASHDVRAVVEHHLGVKASDLSGDPLNKHGRVRGVKDGVEGSRVHVGRPPRWGDKYPCLADVYFESFSTASLIFSSPLRIVSTSAA